MRYVFGMRIVAECLETGEQFELIKEYDMGVTIRAFSKS